MIINYLVKVEVVVYNLLPCKVTGRKKYNPTGDNMLKARMQLLSKVKIGTYIM